MPTGMLCYWLLVCSVYSVTIGMLCLFCYWLLVCSIYSVIGYWYALFIVIVYWYALFILLMSMDYWYALFNHLMSILLISIGMLCLFT